MYEVLDDTTAGVVLSPQRGDSIRRVAQRLHAPYETVRQAVNRLEDAGYVWTRGGYQVGRDPDDYPLFLAVRERDVAAWESFFASFGVPTGFERRPPDELDGSLQVVLEPREALDVEHVDGYPVVPRVETIEYMREHSAQFQSAQVARLE